MNILAIALWFLLPLQDPDQARLEKIFQETLSGCELVGWFTIENDPESEPRKDRYAITKATKKDGDRWEFVAQFVYGGQEWNLPLVFPVKWAGDTPVLTVTDFKLPGFGTYSARLLIDGSQYAGTWSSKTHYGLMYGKIVPLPKEEKKENGGGQEQTAENTINWPSFHGPRGRGVAAGFPTATTWSVEENRGILWTSGIPGLAHSSPVVWGDRIFVTSAIGEKEAELKIGLYGNTDSVPDEGTQRFVVYCLEKAHGSVIWEKTAFEGKPQFKRHPKGSFAASTPATDGQHVVAFFGSEGLHCYDADGNLKWKKDFGPLDAGWFVDKSDQWGFASSPVIHDGMVIVQCDVLNGSFVAALDIADGKIIWRKERDEVPTWSTPTVDVRPGRSQVILNGYKHIGGYDLKTGEELWKLRGGGDIPVPTPIVAHDLIYIASAHGRMAPLYAIDVMANGEISREHESMAWSEERAGFYMQTPVVLGEYVYGCRDNGLLRCYDAKNGEKKYEERLGGGASGFTASLIAADGKLYVTSEAGDVYVVEAGPEFRLLAQNSLGEECMATPAVTEGILIWRTRHRLIAIEPAW